MARAIEGDDLAFGELVLRTHADTYALAFRLTGNEDDACDVVQESYLRAYRGIRRFRGESKFSTWMYRITANCASSYLSKRSRGRHEELDEGAIVIDERLESDPEAMASGALERASLAVAVDSLPPRLRAVVVLRDIYDLAHEAIAEELGISETAAKVRLHRARRKLREQLLPTRAEVRSRAV